MLEIVIKHLQIFICKFSERSTFFLLASCAAADCHIAHIMALTALLKKTIEAQ